MREGESGKSMLRYTRPGQLLRHAHSSSPKRRAFPSLHNQREIVKNRYLSLISALEDLVAEYLLCMHAIRVEQYVSRFEFAWQ